MNEVDSLWEGEVFMGHHMAHEMIHSISLRKISMLLKLGIGKAYEKVDGPILYKVLEKFEFSKKWIN